MNAAILDGVFTGKVNGMRAAMTESSRSVATPTRPWPSNGCKGDLARLYQAARQTVGDPGDLTAIGQAEPASPQPLAGPAFPSPGPTAEARCEKRGPEGRARPLCQGIITPTSGNVSVRLENNPTRSGSHPAPSSRVTCDRRCWYGSTSTATSWTTMATAPRANGTSTALSTATGPMSRP